MLFVSISKNRLENEQGEVIISLGFLGFHDAACHVRACPGASDPTSRGADHDPQPLFVRRPHGGEVRLESPQQEVRSSQGVHPAGKGALPAEGAQEA